MFKMSTCGVALLLAGMVGLACGGSTTGQNDCEKAGGTCEQITPGTCLGGWSPNTEGYSCRSSFTVCCLPLSHSPCETAGGTCAATAGTCPSGTIDDTSQYSCSNMGGPSTCCMPSGGGGASGVGGAGGGAGSSGATGGPPDAGVAKNTQDAGTRTPLLHRAVGVACPTGRAPGLSICDCAGSDGSCLCAFGECGQDSNCTAGISGRCLMNGPAPITACSYDMCFSDSDCPPKTPCDCRDSASSSAPNSCLTGSDCRVDSDCGPGNFCSPSAVSWYGTAYHCHTSSDTCVDDSDCGQFENCVFDVQNSDWSCVVLPPPPP